MISDRLRAAISNAAQLPPAAQDKVAAQLESAILNAQWDADLDDPQNDAWLAAWIAEARQEEFADAVAQAENPVYFTVEEMFDALDAYAESVPPDS